MKSRNKRWCIPDHVVTTEHVSNAANSECNRLCLICVMIRHMIIFGLDHTACDDLQRSSAAVKTLHTKQDHMCKRHCFLHFSLTVICWCCIFVYVRTQRRRMVHSVSSPKQNRIIAKICRIGTGVAHNYYSSLMSRSKGNVSLQAAAKDWRIALAC